MDDLNEFETFTEPDTFKKFSAFKGFDTKHNRLNLKRKQQKRKMYSKEYIRSCLRRLSKEALVQSPLQEYQELITTLKS